MTRDEHQLMYIHRDIYIYISLSLSLSLSHTESLRGASHQLPSSSYCDGTAATSTKNKNSQRSVPQSFHTVNESASAIFWESSPNPIPKHFGQSARLIFSASQLASHLTEHHNCRAEIWEFQGRGFKHFWKRAHNGASHYICFSIEEQAYTKVIAQWHYVRSSIEEWAAIAHTYKWPA